jgi:hypothetical protein
LSTRHKKEDEFKGYDANAEKNRLSYPPEGSIMVSTKPVEASLIDLKPLPAPGVQGTEQL